MKKLMSKTKLPKASAKPAAPKKAKGVKRMATSPQGLGKELKGLQKQARPKPLKY